MTETVGDTKTRRPLGGRATTAVPAEPPATRVDQQPPPHQPVQPDAPFATEEERLVSDLVDALEATGGDEDALEAELFGSEPEGTGIRGTKRYVYGCSPTNLRRLG